MKKIGRFMTISILKIENIFEVLIFIPIAVIWFGIYLTGVIIIGIIDITIGSSNIDLFIDKMTRLFESIIGLISIDTFELILAAEEETGVDIL